MSEHERKTVPVALCTLILLAMVLPALLMAVKLTAPGIAAAEGTVAPVITSISVENATVLINGDGAGPDAKTVVRITIRAQDNDGIGEIDNAGNVCFVTIYDFDNSAVIDNLDISSSYSQIDDNTAQWFYDFDPADGSAMGDYRFVVVVNDEFNMSVQRQPRRRPVTITTGENATYAGYQVRVTVPYDSEMASNYSDIRFFLENGAPLDFWIENYTGSVQGTDNAYVWVEMPMALGASTTTTINLVYAAPDIASTENGDNVFVLFDDFSGSSLDASKWSSDGTVTVTDGVARVSGPASSIYSVSRFGPENAMKTLANIENGGQLGVGFSGDANSGAFINHDYINFSKTIESDGDGYTETSHPDALAPGIFNVYQVTKSGFATRFYYNDENDRNGDNLMRDAVRVNQAERNAAAATWNDIQFEVDWFFVRKFVEGEPTASVGAEENYSEVAVVGAWRSVESWTGTITAAAAWAEVEGWQATIKAPGWLLSEVWLSTITAAADWLSVETWGGAATNSVTWQIVESWSGTISTPSEQSQQQSSPPAAAPSDTTSPKLEILEPTTENVGETVTVRVRVTDSSGIDNSSIVVTLDNENFDYVFSDGIITVDFANLPIGEHRLYIFARDASGNRNAASTEILLRVSSEPLMDNLLISLENGENAVVALENWDVSEIVMKIENASGPVENLQVLVSTVENVDENRPENFKVYSYFEISVPGYRDVVSSADIKFKVRKDWIMENGLSPLAVVLYRLGEDGWVELPTEIIGEDNDFYFFSARTSSFSIFAIGGRVIFPTLELVLPHGAIEVENGYVAISLWVRNPTAVLFSKNLELRFESGVTPFEINVEPGENELITIYVLLENAHGETCNVELCDAETQTVLDKGEVTLLSSSEIPVDTASPVPHLLVFAILSIVASVGSIKIYGKIRQNGHVVSPSARRKVTKLKEANKDSFKISPIVQEYYELLLPVARKASGRTRVKKRKNF